ncbi:MAG TPA: helix-turn-helix domain-containing protein [Casimicrobiaceae bacterium]|nr:helix-turn-helix domain-containing protein [Casimicrobiaceae bacterium]
MDIVLECLRKHGQRLDHEIAHETGLPLADVHVSLEALVKAGAVMTCKLTRFERGNRIEALQCRFAGYFPPRAPGRKAT